MPYENWRELLAERFPARDPEVERREWDTLKDGLAVGQVISGVVVSKAPFGAWLDINVGFPGLLLIPDVARITPERCQADEWCPLGSTVEAEIVLFNDPVRQIRVSQGLPHESR